MRRLKESFLRGIETWVCSQTKEKVQAKSQKPKLQDSKDVHYTQKANAGARQKDSILIFKHLHKH
jgi:hypothetical protein